MKRKRHRNFISLKSLIFILWLCCIYFYPQTHKIAEAGDTELFQCTLTIQRTDCDEGEDNTSSIKIGFTKNGNATIVPAPPQPPGYCIHASIDPNNTKSDNNDFDFPYNTRLGWERAILPEPSESAQWGLMIRLRYQDPNETLPLDLNERVPLRITWNPNELGDGVFSLIQYRIPFPQEYKKIDMHDQSEFELEADQENTNLKISYISSEEYKVFGIICVGGTKKENKGHGLFEEFSDLSFMALETFGESTEEPLKRIKYITYYYPPIPLFDQTILENSQKERLEYTIVNWLPKRLDIYNTKNSVLLIYIVDHGNKRDGSINIDPKTSDPNNTKLSGNELNVWLNDLETKLHNNQNENFEIIIIVEACYSGKFIEQLTDFSLSTAQRVLISSADYNSKSEIVIGGSSFSGYLFDKLFKFNFSEAEEKPYTIGEAYENARNQINKKSNQNPQFYPNPLESYFIDSNNFSKKYHLVEDIPDIENISILDQNLNSLDPNNILPFRHNTLYFSISISNSDYLLKNAWMDIFHTTPSGELNKIRTDPNDSYFYGYENPWLFSPGYCLCYPGIYEFWIYVEDENNHVSIPHPFYFEIPYSPDEYEPDDTPDQKLILLTPSNPQIHYLSDSNDIDWIKIPIPINGSYTIKIKPIDQSLDDPNIYRIKAFKKLGEGLEEIDFTLKKFSGTEIFFFHTMEVEEPGIFYLKISSGIDRKWPLPYKIEITGTAADDFKIYLISIDDPNCLNINDKNDFVINTDSQDNFLSNPIIKWVGNILCISIVRLHLKPMNFSLWIRNHNIMTIEINNDNSSWEIIDFPLNESNDDFDQDGFTNGEECSMGTDPLDPFDPSIISLSEGWNLISFQVNKCFYEKKNPPLSYIDSNIIDFEEKESLLTWLCDDTNSPIRDTMDPNYAGDWKRIISFDKDGAHILDKDLPPGINTLHYISFGYGYWIKMNKDGFLRPIGKTASPDTPLNLQKGWNLIGFIPQNICYTKAGKTEATTCPYHNRIYQEGENILCCPIDPLIESVFASIQGKYRRIISFDCCAGAMFYDTQVPSQINTLHYIGPKYGYWIKMEENGELIYPNGILQ